MPLRFNPVNRIGMKHYSGLLPIYIVTHKTDYTKSSLDITKIEDDSWLVVQDVNPITIFHSRLKHPGKIVAKLRVENYKIRISYCITAVSLIIVAAIFFAMYITYAKIPPSNQIFDFNSEYYVFYLLLGVNIFLVGQIFADFILLKQALKKTIFQKNYASNK